jgi:MarR family transcriptional regulator, multiple antibiotic resistance protein MarR
MNKDPWTTLVSDLLTTHSLFIKLVRQGWRRKGPSDFSVLHFHILGVLLHSGTLSVSEIGKRLHVSKPNMTPLIERLVQEGMVIRNPEPKDRRVIKIALTKKGRGLMESGRKRMQGEMEKVFRVFTDGEMKRFSEALRTLKDLLLKTHSQETQ